MKFVESFISLVLIAVLAATHPATRGTSPATMSGKNSDPVATVTGKIGKSLPNFKFQMMWHGDTLKAIEVTRLGTPNARPIQSLTVPASSLTLDAAKTRDDFLNVEDLNFDGFKDLKLLSSWGDYGGTELYDVWLFDRATSRFVSYPEFSQIVAPIIDAPTKQILSYGCGRALCDEHDFRSYGYLAGKLTLLREEQQDLADGSSSVLVRTVTSRTGLGRQEVCRILLQPDGSHRLLLGSLKNCGILQPTGTGEWRFGG
jgi:hypothetical protein